MKDKSNLKMQTVQSTMLIPLWGRAKASEKNRRYCTIQKQLRLSKTVIMILAVLKKPLFFDAESVF